MASQQSLTRQTVSGLGWSFGALGLAAALQLVYTSIISRLLDPADFGVMAAVFVAIGLVGHLSRLGLATALIQRDALPPNEEATAVALSVVLGVVGALVAILVSPAVSGWVGVAEAGTAMRWMALAVLLTSIDTVIEALLRRRMKFRAAATSHLLSYAIGYLLIGTLAARAGWGLWSIVAASIAQLSTKLVLNLLQAHPTIKRPLSPSAAMSMMRFGGPVALSGIGEYVSSNLDVLAIGRHTDPGTLGQYSRAKLLAGLPMEQARTVLNKVFLPGLSRTSQDRERHQAAVMSLIGLSSVAAFSAAAVIAAGAPNFVAWLLGDGWEKAAALVPIAVWGYAFVLLTGVSATVLEAAGAAGRRLRAQTAGLVLTAALLFVAVAVGPTVERLAVAWALGETIRYTLHLFAMSAVVGLRLGGFVRRLGPSACLAVASAAPLCLVVQIQERSGVLVTAVSGGIGLLLVGVALLTPLGRPIRRDLIGLRDRLTGTGESQRVER